MYPADEDSFLLQKLVLKYTKGNVLDMGCGSGIQSLTALKKTPSVLAVDINPEAVKFCKKKGINAIQSNLFENLHGKKFDLIIFNPPYLPKSDNDYGNEPDLTSGKIGSETIEKFLKEAKAHLNKNGKILILFSSLTKNISKIIKKYNYKFKKLAKKRFFFETLYVYLIW
ncbi:methyltransferase [Candidatus Pacearchaeota archaeon]|nr:methyltransferase [Candidatus Pacearchaeota archaeon]